MSVAQVPIDTIYTAQGPAVLFSNRSWEYLEDLKFDGILNQHIHKIISSDSTLNYFQSWDNDMCYTSDKKNDLTKLNDTIWMCVENGEIDEFVMPFDGFITSRYGYRKGRYHNGIDIDLVTGDTVKSCWSGKIRYAKFNDGGFGNLVIVRHNNGLETFYAHLSKLIVAPNQEVKAGDPIGLGGNTGHSRGSHLHFEIRFYDAAMNPEEIIDLKEKKVKDANLFLYESIFRPGAKPSDSPYFVSTSTSQSSSNYSSASSRKYYKIRSGDTLSEIAGRYGTTISKLCKLNGIRTTTKLQIGRSLRVR
jgi:hypothetical protein